LYAEKESRTAAIVASIRIPIIIDTPFECVDDEHDDDDEDELVIVIIVEQ